MKKYIIFLAIFTSLFLFSVIHTPIFVDAWLYVNAEKAGQWGIGADFSIYYSLGAVQIGRMTEPALLFKDSDCTDSDINAKIYIDMDNANSGVEDTHIYFQRQQDGNMYTFMESYTTRGLKIHTSEAIDQDILSCWSGESGVFKISTDASGDGVLSMRDANYAPIHFVRTDGGDSYFGNTGDWGFGTMTPDTKLHVAGAITADSGFVSGRSTEPSIVFKDANCDDSDINAKIYANAIDGNSGTEDINLYFQRQIGGNLTTVMECSDNLGLRVTAPGNNSQTILSGKAANGNSAFKFKTDSDGDAYVVMYDANADVVHQWGSDPSDSFFNNTGNWGFGTTTPDEKLHVVGNIKVDGIVKEDTPGYFPKLYNDFFYPGANMFSPWYAAAISSGQFNAHSTLETINNPGVDYVRGAASATENSGYFLTTGITSLLLGGSESTTFIFQVMNDANTLIRLGFQDSITASDPTDGVWIDIVNALCTGKTADNTVIVATDTNCTLTEDTWYKATISINAAVTITTFSVYTLPNTLVWSDTLTGGIPTEATELTGHGFVAVDVNGTNSYSVFAIDYMDLEINRALTR